MDIGGYKYNYEGFYANSTYQMSISRRRMTTTQAAHARLVRILSFLLFLLVNSFEDKIQPSENHVDTTRG